MLEPAPASQQRGAPSPTDERWDAARSSDKVVPQWSLKQSCLSTVKDSVLGWSRGRRNSVHARCPDQNPFLEYPIDLRSDLLSHLLRLKPTGRELLKAAELLTASGLPAFDAACLDDCRFADLRVVLESLALSGACLRELSLAGQWLYHEGGPALAARLIAACPNLRHLRLQHTTREGRELELALRSCPLLTKLEIMHPSLDDAEVDALCAAMEEDPTAFEGSRTTLRELKLPSSVRGRGALLLVRALPALEYVALTHLDEAIEELEASPDPSAWRDRLERLRGVHVSLPVCPDTPELLVGWCPNLEEVSLEVQEEMELRPLTRLRRLRSLELKNSPTLPLSYTEEVLPLLSACGRRLCSLSLERFDLIDLAKTTTYCPGLRAFSAQWFTVLSHHARGSRYAPQLQFLQLRYLRLRPRVGRKVTPEACEALLTHSACLKHLEFYCSFGLTDALVSRLLLTNQFRQLRTLLLRHGHGLSSRGVAQLTRRALNLKVWDVGAIHSKGQAPPS